MSTRCIHESSSGLCGAPALRRVGLLTAFLGERPACVLTFTRADGAPESTCVARVYPMPIVTEDKGVALWAKSGEAERRGL